MSVGSQGAQAEQWAAQYLQRQGLEPVAQQYLTTSAHIPPYRFGVALMDDALGHKCAMAQECV